MKKILLFLLMAVVFLVGCSSAKKGKTADKVYEGQYIRALNIFTHKKDNLVFKDKTVTYSLQDNSGALDLIYDSIGRSHGVTDEDVVTLKVSGRVSNGVLIVRRVLNYRIPVEKMNGEILELQ